MRPFVSVLIPTAGHRPALLEIAQASALASAYPRDRFEVITQPDEGRGESYAINRAFERCRGEFVTVLEDDDRILPHKLDVLAAALEANPEAGGVYSLPVYDYEDERPDDVPEKVARWLRAHPTVTWDTIVRREGCLMHGAATMFRRSAWEVAGPWDETLTAGEEWEYHLRLLRSGATLLAVDNVTTVYRIHVGQKSARSKRRTTERMLQIAKINARYAVPDEVPV